MRARTVASAVLLLLVAIHPSPAFATAAATGTVTPAASIPAKVLSSSCSDGYVDGEHTAVARSADGRVHGFANFRNSDRCGDRITYFEGSGTSWRSQLTSLSGTVVDVAADRTGTYLLCITRASGAAELVVVKRSTDGTIARQASIAAIDASRPQDGYGSIVAAGGTWYAVWPQYTGGERGYVLYQAETMFGGGAEPGAFAVGDPPGTTAGTRPALALGPDGQPRLFWQRANADGTQDLMFTAGAYGAWGSVSRVAGAETLSPDFADLDVAVTGNRTYLSWTRRTDVGDQVIVADGAPGSWRTSTPPAEDGLGSWDAHLVASGDTVIAGYGSGDGAPDGAFVGSRTGSGAWSAGDATVGIPRSIDSLGVAGLVYDGGGHSTTLVYSGNNLFAVIR